MNEADLAATGLPMTAPSAGLCLDFANTRYWRWTPEPTDELKSFADLIAWCAKADPRRSDYLRSVEPALAPTPQAATAVFHSAIALREAIYAIFSATATHEAAEPAALAWLNQALRRMPLNYAIEPGPGEFHWRVSLPRPSVETLLAPVLWSAGNLLVDQRLVRVKCCANPVCRWVFLDESKGATRRWCTMAGCGNRAKAHRHYAKSKGKK